MFKCSHKDLTQSGIVVIYQNQTVFIISILHPAIQFKFNLLLA